MYESELRTEISQGDIFHDVPVVYAKTSGEVDFRRVPAILITRDCDYDKPDTKFVYVAQIVPLTGSERFQTTIRACGASVVSKSDSSIWVKDRASHR